jgi:hypothetical protein
MVSMGNSRNYEMRLGPTWTPAVKFLTHQQHCSSFFIAKAQYRPFLQCKNLGRYICTESKYGQPFLHLSVNFLQFFARRLSGIFSLTCSIFGSLDVKLKSLWGKKNFYILYFLSAFMGGFVTWLVHNLGINQHSVVGASGGVLGVMVVFALLWPNREVLFWGIFPIKMKFLIPLLMVMMMFNGDTHIAHMAHLGGLIGGVIFFFAKTKYKYDFNFSISRYLQKQKMKRYQEEMYRRQNAKETVDELLDKISKKGMKSLSRKEKQFLKDASTKYYAE